MTASHWRSRLLSVYNSQLLHRQPELKAPRIDDLQPSNTSHRNGNEKEKGHGRCRRRRVSQLPRSPAFSESWLQRFAESRIQHGDGEYKRIQRRPSALLLRSTDRNDDQTAEPWVGELVALPMEVKHGKCSDLLAMVLPRPPAPRRQKKS
jgi:hypothetical protein